MIRVTRISRTGRFSFLTVVSQKNQQRQLNQFLLFDTDCIRQLLHCRKIFLQRVATLHSDTVSRFGPFANEGFVGFYISGIFEFLKMRSQGAVCRIEAFFQGSEVKLTIHLQCDKDAEANRPVDCRIQGVEIKFYSSQVLLNQQLETEIDKMFAAGDGAGVSRGLVQASACGTLIGREILSRIGKR